MRKKLRAQGRAAGLRLNHSFPFITSEMYKSHFSMSVHKTYQCYAKQYIYTQSNCDVNMMILRSIALCIAEKHL